jgi:hypothetical protein
MIDSKIQDNSKISSEFPCLKIKKSLNLVVLFNSHGTGMCINSGGEHNKVGEFRTDWNEFSFELLNDSILLKNK